jgi:hypothetical protein
MPNAWISHIRNYAKENNIKYSDALKDPGCSASYKTGSGLTQSSKVGHFDNLNLDYSRPLENADITDVPVTKPKKNKNYKVHDELEVNKKIARRGLMSYFGRGVGGLNKVMANRSMERGLIHHGMTKPVKQPFYNMTRYGPAGTFTREDAIRMDKEYKEAKEIYDKAKVTPVTY